MPGKISAKQKEILEYIKGEIVELTPARMILQSVRSVKR